jgi:hypothetical protein
MKLSPGWMLLCAFALPAQAQDEFEPDFEIDDAPASRWTTFGDFVLRGDRVTGLPNNRDDLERARARLRLGALWQGDGALSFGVAGEAGIGTDDNRDNLINNDVEKSDAVGLDQAWLRWRWSPHVGAQLGKAPLPLELSPLLWDNDLRPLGASLRFGGPSGEFDRWQLDFGAFEPDPLNERSAKLAAVQLGWHWREGAPVSFGGLLGYLDYSDLDDYARAGLGRGNSVVAGRYVNDYQLLDLQLYLRMRVGDRPLEARLDRVNNIDADDADDGTRASLVLGDRFAGGWEFGWAWQRIQRNAVLAAVNADDWWFHAAARGHMPWIGYGFNPTWTLRVAAFLETRDGLSERTDRLLVDLEARW